ncbi:hypothetical protein [Actinomadura chokoriensis]|uniref:hypothetical protein n=1 Tax=Actinomadura chokoriensis TaxID=454156 RepID=UPI0031F89B72
MTLVRPPGTDPDDARRALQSPEPQAVEEAQPQAVEEQDASHGEPASAGWMRPLITKVGAFATCVGAAAGAAAAGGRLHPSMLVIALGLVVLPVLAVLVVIICGLVFPQIIFAKKGASLAKTPADVTNLMKASAAAFTHPFAALVRGQTADDVHPAEEEVPGARQEAAEPTVGDLQRQIDELRTERDGAERPGPGPGGGGSVT